MPVVKTTTKSSNASSAASRIISLNELPDQGIKLCVYGKSGTGKTRLVGSFAKLGPMLHMICSSNGTNEARSIKGTPNVDCVEIQKPQDLLDLINLAKDSKYKTLALDHVTGFSDCVLADILGVDRLYVPNF
jgi:hypothetical protein